MLSSENGTGMYMPVAPAYGGNGGFSMGGDWAWIILLLLAFGGGWGGGFGGNEMFPWLNNSNQMNNGFQNQMLNTSINGIQNAITSGFGDVQTALCGGFAGVNAGIANGFAQAEIANNARQIADMQQNFANQTATLQGFNGLQGQLAQCCCDNRLATCQTQNIIQTEAAATRSALQNGVQAVLDKMCQDKIDSKNETIVNLNNRINFLEENNYVQNALTAQTQYLINQLRTDTPTAATAG